MSLAQDIRLAARHRKETRTDLLRRIDDMEQQHKAELARRDRTEGQLVCALRKASGEVDTKNHELTTAIAVAVGRLNKISELEGEIKFQARKVVRAEADVRRLAASLKNTQQELERAKPRVVVAENPARIPPYAPADPADWELIDPAGQAMTVGTWMPFPPDPDATQEIPVLADLLTGRA